MKYYIVLIIMTILGACGSFYLKKASDAKKNKNISYNASILFRWFIISDISNIEYLHFEVLGLFCGTSFNFDYIYMDVCIILLLFERRYYTQKNYRDCLNRFGKYYYCSMIEIIIECKCRCRIIR